MKLQRHLSRKNGDKSYSKWVIIISPQNVKQLGWKAGDELEDEVLADRLIIRPKRDSLRNH
jgi:hypothetical protein